MEILNPGHVLPFYANKKSKLRYRPGCKEFNWAIPVNQGESLNFQTPIDLAPLSSYTFYVLDEDEAEIQILESAKLLYTQDLEDNAWVSYHGDSSILAALDCGVYSISIKDSRGRAIMYSEDFRVKNIDDREKAFKLTFSNTTDIDGIIYQGGYSQKAWLLGAVFDTPEIIEPIETATDGNAVEVPTFQSVQRREVLKFPYFPDYWHGVFQRLKMIDSVFIQKLETAEFFELTDTGINIETEDQDVCFKKGVLSWISSTQVTSGCEENKGLLYLNNVLT